MHALLDAGLGSVLLVAATAVSLLLANSVHSHAWLDLWVTHAGPAALGLHLSLREWVRSPSYTPHPPSRLSLNTAPSLPHPR